MAQCDTKDMRTSFAVMGVKRTAEVGRILSKKYREHLHGHVSV